MPDKNPIAGLQESQNRVRAMALIHEKLYQSSNLAKINFLVYLQSLTNSLAQTYRISMDQVSIQIKGDSINLDIDTAIPCGLIVNELVSNSLKYAFPDGRSGRIEVTCQVQTDGMYALMVCDNGVGLPVGLNPTQTSSLGIKLVDSLVRQIDGELQVECQNGTRFKLVFP